MKSAWTRVAITAAAVVLATGAFVARALRRAPGPEGGVSVAGPNGTTAADTASRALPRLVDLGAGKCIPCKMMVPILEELKKEYAGRLVVEFIDVWESPAAGQEYGIRMIPTQVFCDATGKELFRHEGFFSREDILAKWRELGVELERE